MAASSSDKFTLVGSPGTATTLSAPGHSIAGTSITVGATTNWPTTTGAIFAIDTVTLVNGVEVRDVGSYTEWEAVVSSSTSITSMVLRYGTDQAYPAGSTTRVYIPVASSWVAQLISGLLISLDEDGTLKAGAVDNAAALASNVVTTAKILDANVTNAKLAANVAWTAWVPTISGITPGNGVTTATYQQIGKIVRFKLVFVFGTTSTIAGNPNFTLPVTSATVIGTSPAFGTGTFFDTSATKQYPNTVRQVDTTHLEVVCHFAANTYVEISGVNATVPFTFATGDEVVIMGAYEAA